MKRKRCSVPMCHNVAPVNKSQASKIFFPIPEDPDERAIWMEAIGRSSLPSSNVFVCGDHFDVENEVIDYKLYLEFGGVPKLKTNVVPHKFECLRRDNPMAAGKVEMEKFKRRLIRAVARLLVHEKKPESEVWVELRKETGCNCKLLWTRMRALTLKKLDRLFAADDCIEAIPRAAKMSLTDWLLFDLVLAHQDIDLIGQDKIRKDDPKPLVELFELVKKFRIEGLEGEELTEAWSLATMYYNKQGHQCSPMLLQRRWYQLKNLTRVKFYKFWNSYRGTIKRLTFAEPHTPTPLQAAIARRFKTLVTSPFLEWEELIKKRFVILPEAFEKQMKERMRQNQAGKKHQEQSDDVPDLELIEPHIETIDLGLDSDYENENETEKETTPATEVKIKEEPPEMDIDIDEQTLEPLQKKSMYDEVLESTSMEHETIDNIEADAIEDNELREVTEHTVETQNSVLPQITNVFGNVDESNEILSKINALSTQITSAVSNMLAITTTSATVVNSVEIEENKSSAANKNDSNESDVNVQTGCIRESADIMAQEESVPETDDVIVQNDCVSETDNLIVQNDCIPETDDIISQNDSEPETDDIIIQGKCVSKSHDAIVQDVCSSGNGNKIGENVSIPEGGDVIAQGGCTPENDNLTVEPECIPEFSVPIASESTLDKTIEKDIKPIIKEHSFIEPSRISEANEKETLDKKPDITSFSFGQLSNDISFVDEGIEFVDDGIAYHEEDNQFDDVKPNIKTEVFDENEKTPEIDAKLLMVPIVYTTRLEDMGMFTRQPFDHVRNKTLLHIICYKSKPIKELPIEYSCDDDHSNENITDDKKVKLSSYMLQKPRSRTYNPIQLCKNPDFNTRLKRLTVGFFSSPRNRVLLKTCKPLTIDLSKAFESKLVSGTLYLKASDQTVKQEIVIDNTESHQNVSVVPSAMPVQSLIDNSKIGDILPLLNQRNLVSPKPPDVFCSTNERNKVINLPDISEIRRINQRLLTAEVTPIQVQNNKPQVPVSIVPSPNVVPTPAEKTISIVEPNKEITASVSKGPPQIVDMTQDSPNNNSLNNSITRSSTVMNRTLGRPSLRGKAPMAPWKPRYTRPEVPWYKNMEASTFCTTKEENLLTLDTLNKMLYLLNKEDMADVKELKGKKKKKLINAQAEFEAQQTADDDVELICETDDISVEQIRKCRKPKINIKSAINYYNSQIQNKNQSTFSVGGNVEGNSSEENHCIQNQKGKNKLAKKKQLRYCCWARERMLQMLFSKKRLSAHECPYPLCTCCCRTLLTQYVDNDRKLKDAEDQGKSTADSDENIGNDNSKKVETTLKTTVDGVVNDASAEAPAKNPVVETPVIAVETSVTDIEHPFVNIENPVVNTENPVENQTPVIEVETPVIEVQTPVMNDQTPVTDITCTTTIVNENKPIEIDDLNTEDAIPTVGGEISVTTTKASSDVECIDDENLSTEYATISINTGKHSKKRIVYRKHCVEIPRRAPYPMPVKAPTLTSDSTSVTLRTLLERKKRMKPKLNTMAFQSLPQTMPSLKTYTPPKHFKDKMIYLNSQQISEMPTNNPIFLGKNKILLTTVKFPHNLKTFEMVKQSLMPTLQLPRGVQLILLPNGTVTYLADPNIKLSAEDLARLPTIVAAVQQQINMIHTVSQPNMPPMTGVTNNEVVNLDDDDDDNTSTIKENKNECNEIPPVAEVQIINADQTKSSDNASLDSCCVDSVKNNVESNNESIADTNTQTEIDQKVSHPHSTHQNVINEKQENVQASSVEALPSTSTEQVQQEISSVDDNTATEKKVEEPNTGNKTKNILSDLMEMSGIFDEDVTTSQEQTPQPADPVEQHPVMTQPLAPMEVPPLLKDISMPQPAQDQNIAINIPPPVVNSRVGELTPITSLFELKYACLNKGSFFKLDFDTGYLLPINVCMKQQSKAQLPKIIDTKSVIDLTDEDDTTNTTTMPEQRSLLIANNSTSPGKIKPIKLFKSVHPGILRRLQPEKTYSRERNTDDVININSNSSNHKQKRKQFLSECELRNEKDLNAKNENPDPEEVHFKRIKLNESHSGKSVKRLKRYKAKTKNPKTDPQCSENVQQTDERNAEGETPPVENEPSKQPSTSLLLQSAKQTKTNIVSDDSSDDEPLAKKAKRKRESMAPAPINVIEVELEEGNEPELSINESSETHYELFLDQSESEEDTEENCILGV